MSPRPKVSRDDASAKQFLRAAARLMDDYLDAPPPQTQEGNSIPFPGALHWLHQEDVIQKAADLGSKGVSHTAFVHRWPNWPDFVPDAVVYAMLVHDDEFEDSSKQAEQVPAVATASASFSDEIIRIATELLASLQRQPRNYLTLHLGPLLPQHPELWVKLQGEMKRAIGAWAIGYAGLLDEWGLVLRHGWTPMRVAYALQAMLDGFLLRYRILPHDYPTDTVDGVEIFADSVVAFVLGVVDAERSGVSSRAAIDAMAPARNHGRDE
jgi:hypothetical protein